MQTIRTVDELRAALGGHRRAGRTIGLVPTMGALHEGHLALVRAARAEADVVVLSLFVNPTQFDDAGDLAAYPRDEGRDAELAEGADVDLLFAPAVAEVYPTGFATTVSVGGVSGRLEGAHRPGHFDGVALVVTKLFGMVRPDVAWFGQKDAQQVAVVRRVVADLDLGVRIETVPTVREPDGLALSSRNVRLGAADRIRGLALRHGLDAVVARLAAGESDAVAAAEAGRAVMRGEGVEPEYLEVVDPDTFEPVGRTEGRPVLVVVAAPVGPVRLIDNELVEPPR
ncbi:pantoate--beta-alanine ligase [Desertihabitans brevis]|uniref:Pantothenate synthetase n=1 Tax=Desertihabitans brevis TaxID=2268447 RepID=A0A367YW93_9ACTN|nr:pantoate--beta-alanine ligase [Desertihabitans brevis]RCK70007.1 pantoate--beta-alanine ligase [Desertihabitans brevis]